jgi:hypothetical protein
LDREEVDPETYRAIALLPERGYLAQAAPIIEHDAPALVTVTALGLEVVGGWPATTAEAATAALLAALDREIEATDEPAERGRLERLRDAAVEVGDRHPHASPRPHRQGLDVNHARTPFER